MGMETNIVPDEQQFFKMFESICSFWEQKYLKDDENKKRMVLMNALRKHVNMGGEIAYNVIPAQYQEKVINALENQSIPYFAAPDGEKNSIVMVREQDKEFLLQIQKDIEFLSTNYVKESTIENLLDIYKRSNIRNVETLSFKNKDMAEIAKQKLYQSGVIFASVEHKDGVKFIVSPQSKFDKNGNDLSCFELHHAFEQSKADEMFGGEKGNKSTEFIQLRLDQAKYDKEQLELLGENIVNRKNCVLCAGSGRQNLYIDVKRDGVFVVEKTNNSNNPDNYTWKQTKLDISANATKQDVAALISKYADKIKDMVVVSPETFRDIKDDFADTNTNLNGYPKRPIDIKFKDLQIISNKQIDSMINSINQEATKRTNIKIKDSLASQEKAYEIKKEQIALIMNEKKLPEIKAFLNPTEDKMLGMSQEDRLTWFNNIENHFKNTYEKTEYSCDLDKTNIKDAQREFSGYLHENTLNNKDIIKDVEKDVKIEQEIEIEKDIDIVDTSEIV